LTGHILVIAVGAVPYVAITFHREPTIQSLNEQIDRKMLVLFALGYPRSRLDRAFDSGGRPRAATSR
jgi:hypothetical protein